MLVNEIFSSIEGEGIRTGYPVTFIRLFGCNMHCGYCDTRYACEGSDFKQLSVDEIVDIVSKMGNQKVTLTGGEPLIHKDVNKLIAALTANEYEVNIETNGSIYIGPYTLNKRVIATVDYKSISSGQNDKMDLLNLHTMRKQDVLKFVVGTQEDLQDMKEVLDKHKPICEVFVSPVFGQIEPIELVKFILENHMQNVRVQLQLHKFIWDPNKRGV